jgi:hypothetical protein
MGNNITTSISTKNSLYLREYSIMPFARLLSKHEYETAYNLCTDEYKKSFSLDEFIERFSKIDADTIQMKQVKARSEYCFEAKVEYKEIAQNLPSGEEMPYHETTYFLYPNEFNSELVKIAPDGFLYAYEDESISQNGISVYIEKCIVRNDEIYIKGTIKNTSWFSKLDIMSIGLSYDGGITSKIDYEKTLEKGDEVAFEENINCTSLMLPNCFQIERLKDEKTIRTYLFYFKDAK